jgi:hypothetical protein
MATVEVTNEERALLDLCRRRATLGGAIHALVAAAQSGELSAKSAGAIDKASETLPESKITRKIIIDHMKAELRAADCLYDSKEIWARLGATNVPEIPESVIREAYEKGGRVILRCSSINEKTKVLRKVNHYVGFLGSASQSDYQASVSEPKWIVVPSHIDQSTLGSPKSEVVTSEMPAPTPEDWFAVIAYARLDGGRQPKGCERFCAFTNEDGTVVGSSDARILVLRNAFCDHRGGSSFCAARFGPPRN